MGFMMDLHTPVTSMNTTPNTTPGSTPPSGADAHQNGGSKSPGVVRMFSSLRDDHDAGPGGSTTYLSCVLSKLSTYLPKMFFLFTDISRFNFFSFYDLETLLAWWVFGVCDIWDLFFRASFPCALTHTPGGLGLGAHLFCPCLTFAAPPPRHARVLPATLRHPLFRTAPLHDDALPPAARTRLGHRRIIFGSSAPHVHILEQRQQQKQHAAAAAAAAIRRQQRRWVRGTSPPPPPPS